MAPKLLLSLPVLLQLAPAALGWGTLGHETVAFIAQNFVTSDTKEFAQNILGITNSSYLASVATWADSYRYTTAGEFSAPYHFIDANDSPPDSCSVDYDRDCGTEGCVVSAIANYTQRVQDSSLSDTQLDQALKWIVHFVGDIHQPLHDEALEVGGNTISVTFDGEDTNLHHIWDTNMPEKLEGGYSLSDAESWATNLTTEIKTGAYASEASSWLTGININDSIATSMSWAEESNGYVCSTVIPNGVDAVEGVDLSGDYYDSSVPVIELQIARAGYRLAAWLNLIATGETSLDVANASVKRTMPMVRVLPENYKRSPTAAQMARKAFGHRC